MRRKVQVKTLEKESELEDQTDSKQWITTSAYYKLGHTLAIRSSDYLWVPFGDK